MNLVQIANHMSSKMTFGDIPGGSFIIDRVNEVLRPEDAIGFTTNGEVFGEIYKKLTTTDQNRIARILDDRPDLRADIADDITQMLNSEKERELANHRYSSKIVIFTLWLFLIFNVYSAYTYHVHAKAKLGVVYHSSFDSVYEALTTVYEQISQTK